MPSIRMYSIHMFTLCDSSWDDDHATSRSTGRFLIFYLGAVVDHSRNMPKYVAMISAEAEYKEACMAMIHMHMTLNHIEEVEDECKEHKPQRTPLMQDTSGAFSILRSKEFNMHRTPFYG
jgi:hypothetical protein